MTTEMTTQFTTKNKEKMKTGLHITNTVLFAVIAFFLVRMVNQQDELVKGQYQQNERLTTIEQQIKTINRDIERIERFQ
jgi:hypothetical protein